MANVVKGSVLEALLALASRKADGGAKKISMAAITKRSGKKKAEVEAILERNKEVLTFDGTAVTGAGILMASGKRGLIVRVVEGISGNSYRQTFWCGGKKLASFNLDRKEEADQADAFVRCLKSDGKIVCQNLSDLPLGIALMVWDEEGALVE